MRVLIIKLSAFGDIIHSLPLIECFKEYSKAYNKKVELHWVIEKQWSPLISGNPAINQVITVSTKEWRHSLTKIRTWREISKFLRKLRKQRYDLILDINCLIRSAVIARMARGVSRIGFSKESRICREKHSVLLLDKTFSVPNVNVVDQILTLVEKSLCLKIQRPVFPYLPVNPVASEKADKILYEKNLKSADFAIITAGGGWQTKLLDERLIADFYKCVESFGVIPVLSWSGENEKKRVGRIQKFIKNGAKDIGDLPIDVFIEILRKSRLVIGPDTGTVHAASAVNTPTVSYYGPSSSKYSGPMRERDHLVQISPHCGPCFKRRCEKKLCNHLTNDRILEAIRRELSSLPDFVRHDPNKI